MAETGIFDPPARTASEAPLTWVADVPLLTNAVVLRAMGLAFLAAYLLIAVLFAVILGVEGDLDRLPRFMAVMGLGFSGAALLCVLVMLVVFRNRMRCRFALDDVGFGATVIDRRAQIGGSLALLTGATMGNATLAGAGLAASRGQSEYTRWDRVAGARFDADRRRITMRAAGWWPVGALHCSEESYQAVADRARRILQTRGLPATQAPTG